MTRELAILLDDAALAGAGRGIFFMDAAGITAADVNRMATHGRGVISASMSLSRAFALGIGRMERARVRPDCPAFLASVEASACCETGISAEERALTLRTLGRAETAPGDLKSPGHIMPAVVMENRSVLPDFGQAIVAASGGLVAAWCDILDHRGNVAGTRDVLALAARLQIEVMRANVSVPALHRPQREPVLADCA